MPAANQQITITYHRSPALRRPRSPVGRLRRTGGVYIAVLGTALMVSLLAMSALLGQRVQNRILTASGDIRQAQLNANTAAELALLTMKQDTNWRTTQPNGTWFSNRSTGAGSCTAYVADPVDSNLSNSNDDPILVRGIGYSGSAEQRVEYTHDPLKQPLTSLRSAIATGDDIDLAGDTLRTDGLITADATSASSSLVYGTVKARVVSGSTYAGTTSQVSASERPTMPDWSTIFDYYRTNGTEISIGSLPTTPTSNFVRNSTFETGTTNWSGVAPGLGVTADVSQSNNWNRNGSFSLRVSNRTHWSAGAVQRIDNFVKPGQAYDVEAFARVGGILGIRSFRIWISTKGTGNGSASSNSSAAATSTVLIGINLPVANISGQVVAPAWSGDLEYAFIKISDDSSSGSTAEFWVDDVSVTEVPSGYYVYRKVLSPTLNPFGGQTNSQGIYWINCNGNRINIERSRILGTLLLINPGSGSRVAHGPIQWSPAVAGYPALLVQDGDFSLQASNRVLSETENLVNFNPAGASHETLGQDADTNDIYQSAIHGMIAIEEDLSYANRPHIIGQILVGDDIGSSSGELDVEYQPYSLVNPPPGFFAPYTYVRRPDGIRKAVLP
jgi:hypothetical protein